MIGRKPPKATLDKAVDAMRVYLGSVGWARPQDEQKLYRRATKALQRIEMMTGLDASNVWGQIEAEARKRGVVRPMPGHHI